MSPEVKEWVRFSHSPGRTTVTVTLVQDNLTARWTAKSYPTGTGIKAGVTEARSWANKALAELVEAVSAVEAVEAVS